MRTNASRDETDVAPVPAPAPGSASAPAPAPDATRHHRSRRRRVIRWALLAVAVGYAAGSGWWYWHTDQNAAVTEGRLRDTVLAAATRDIADLNTVNDRHIGAWEARWLADTTGALHRQVQQTNASVRRQITRVQTSSAATVTSAAVIRLNQRAGTATVIAVVQVRQTASSGGVNTVVNRYVAVLARSGGQWKVGSLKPA